ncbi:MAG: hypothetical protein AAFY88_29970, partial [Acidobacteriota bacterium]
MRWLAELRTFSRPGRPDSPPPAPGELAPDDSASGPRLVVFLRHAGCPFAEATVRELERHRRRARGRFPVVLYSEASPEILDRWLRAVDGGDLDVRP